MSATKEIAWYRGGGTSIRSWVKTEARSQRFKGGENDMESHLGGIGPDCTN